MQGHLRPQTGSVRKARLKLNGRRVHERIRIFRALSSVKQPDHRTPLVFATEYAPTRTCGPVMPGTPPSAALSNIAVDDSNLPGCCFAGVPPPRSSPAQLRSAHRQIRHTPGNHPPGPRCRRLSLLPRVHRYTLAVASAQERNTLHPSSACPNPRRHDACDTAGSRAGLPASHQLPPGRAHRYSLRRRLSRRPPPPPPGQIPGRLRQPLPPRLLSAAKNPVAANFCGSFKYLRNCIPARPKHFRRSIAPNFLFRHPNCLPHDRIS